MSIIRVSELEQTTGITANSLFLTSYGDTNPRTSKYITKQDLLGQYATTGSNTFYGDQTINGGLTITGLTAGSLNDSAMVINPVTHVVSTMPQGLRTTYGLFSQTADSVMVSGTTAESSLIGAGVGSLIIPANGFAIGDSFKADLGGVLSAQNNDTIRIRIKAANTGMLLGDSGVQSLSNVTNNVWTLSLNFIIRQIGGAGVASIGTIGRFSYNKTVNGAIEGFAFNTVNNTTFNTTIQTEIIITVEFGSSSINNKMYSDMFILNKIY